VQVLAAGCAFTGLGLSFAVSRRARFGGATLRLVLAGIAVSAVFSAGVGALKVMADPLTQLQELTFWLLGGLQSITWSPLLSIAPAVLASAAGLPKVTGLRIVGESARNRFLGLVTKGTRDGVMAQVEIQAGTFRVVSLLSREAADEPGPSIVVTHDPLDALVLADRILVLEGGRATQQGRPADVAATPPPSTSPG
jgi:hypothetical protein